MPGCRHVVHSLGMLVLGFGGVVRGVEPSVQETIRELLWPVRKSRSRPRERQPGPRCTPGRALKDLSLFCRPALKPFPPSCGIVRQSVHVRTGYTELTSVKTRCGSDARVVSSA